MNKGDKIMGKIIKVAIIGGGSRGIDAYGTIMNNSKKYQIVALCDKRIERLNFGKSLFKLSNDALFKDEKDFFKIKRGDLCVVATQDLDHVNHAIKALKLGYDVLCEKPITPDIKECNRLLDAQKKYNKKVIICHVLRYAPAFVKVSELIESGVIGKLIDIDAIEQVAYWHQAHSYVRGNWRNSKTTSPMILAKCCHDMDLLQYYAKSPCKCISSMGSLDFFKKSNKPKGAAKRCQNCKYIDTCPYSAKTLYLKWWKDKGSPSSIWPCNVICTDYPLTGDKIKKAYESNNYGRCVFDCDNDVVDHQQSIITFENGITANLCMTAFTGNSGRIYKFHGTYGEIDLDEEHAFVSVKEYGKKEKIISFEQIIKNDSMGHGGGDTCLINYLYDILTNKTKAKTSLKDSIESHLMCYASEESRLNNGKLVFIKHHK